MSKIGIIISDAITQKKGSLGVLTTTSETAAHLLRLQPALYSICERVSIAGQSGS
jgi:hypothetical protein